MFGTVPQVVETLVADELPGAGIPVAYLDPWHQDRADHLDGLLQRARRRRAVLHQLADEYALDDNYHQAAEGGTGANHIMLGFGTSIFYADASGNPTTPPTNQIENPNAQKGTNNWWAQDGYSGGSYVNCADSTQPGVAQVRDYEKSLPYKVLGACRKGAYYLVNNYNPGYLGAGVAAPLGPNQFTVPPTRQNNLALVLNSHQISWKYYGEGWANGTEAGPSGSSTYCNICTYGDHVSFDKFVEANWGLETIGSDTRDNLPNPITKKKDPYAPINAPAISDLMDMFRFRQH